MIKSFLFDHLLLFLRGVRNKKLCLQFLIAGKLASAESCRFRCNVCGKTSFSPDSVVRHRESPSCCFCGSNKRFRSIVAELSKELFDEIIPLPQIENFKDIVGVGLSDSDVYAKSLTKVFSYQNTYYHKDPRLDITCPPKGMFNRADFIIASDIFEHIAPPTGPAFDNLFKILKKGGVCIFSVPYTNQGVTKEHFPELFNYKIIKRNGRRILVNITREGKEQIFENLQYHGGPGTTLEMRLFSRTSLMKDIKNAGFIDVKIHNSDIPEFGIFADEGGASYTMTMRKPYLHE